MRYLKQSTAITLKMGPFLDETDGKTAEVGLAIAQADVRLSKNGAAFGPKNDANAAVHDEVGWYGVQLDVTDTNTLGRLIVAIHEAGALPVWVDCTVVTANVWDTLCGADKLEVDLLQMGGVAQSATDLKDFADAGYDPATDKVQGVVLVDTATAVTNDVGITQAAADKAWNTAARTLTAFGTLVADVADGVWDELRAGHVGAGSFGQGVASVVGSVGSVVGNVGGNVVGSVASVVGNVGGSVASVIGNVGGNVVGTVASVVGSVGSVVGDVGGNIVGNVQGTVASVVGAVGSVIGNVGGSVASVVGNVGGNVVGTVASVVGSVGSVVGDVGGNVVGSVGSVLGNVVGSVGSVVGNVGGNVLGTVASVVGSVASVVGNVGGNIVGNVQGTVASVVGNVGGNVVGTVASVVGNVGGSVASMLVAGRNEIADSTLSRAISNTEAAAPFRSLTGGIAKLVNHVRVVGGNLVVYETDDATPYGTQALTTDAAADPIVRADTV